MSDKFTLYTTDDEEELANWIEDMAEIFSSESAVLKQGVKLLRQEKGEEFQELLDKYDDAEEFV